MKCLPVCALLVLFLAGTRAEGGSPEPPCDGATTVLVVRHADRAGAADSLSEAGLQRAQALLHLAGASGIQAIYQSNTRRARDTAAPLAARLGISPVEQPGADIEGLARHILENQCGSRVLVVGHSNTVGKIVEALGGPAVPELDGAEYDRLFVVTVRRGTPPVLLGLQFGEPSP